MLIYLCLISQDDELESFTLFICAGLGYVFNTHNISAAIHSGLLQKKNSKEILNVCVFICVRGLVYLLSMYVNVFVYVSVCVRLFVDICVCLYNSWNLLSFIHLKFRMDNQPIADRKYFFLNQIYFYSIKKNLTNA